MNKKHEETFWMAVSIVGFLLFCYAIDGYPHPLWFLLHLIEGAALVAVVILIDKVATLN